MDDEEHPLTNAGPILEDNWTWLGTVIVFIVYHIKITHNNLIVANRGCVRLFDCPSF